MAHPSSRVSTPTELSVGRALTRAAFCAVLLLLMLPVTGLAEKSADLKPQGYVSDFAQVLNANTASQVSALCQEIDQKAHAQIAVVTVHSLDNVPIDMFANDLFTRWGVGYKGSDRGVMILLSIQDRHYRIEVGYGLEPVLTDALTGRFGRQVVPALRQGNYSGAVLQLTRDVAGVIAKSSHVQLTNSLADAVPRHQADGGPGPYLPLIVILGILGFGILSAFGSRSRGRAGWRRRGGWWGGPWMGGGWGGGGWGGGRGGFGGGFGGFGGGASGGGGTSGGW